MNFIGVVLFAALSSFTVSQAMAFPLPTAKAIASLPPTFTTNYDFEGIVELSNCSGSLIRFENSADTDFAMILTNGHCYEKGFLRPGAFITHQPNRRSFTLMNKAGNGVGSVTASEVIYATMTQTDITLYKLTMTFAQILSRYAVRPLTLSSAHPVAGQPIEVISGYWERGYSCGIESFIPQLREENWTFADSIRYSRPGCEVIGGTSGSPIIQTGTRTVVAINNTTNENGERCTRNNPCEVEAAGTVSFTKGFSYGQETFWIYGCLDAQNNFDLATPGCTLTH